MRETFGQVLRQLRTKQGHSQRDLASLMDVHYTYISKLEHDDNSPGRAFVEAVAGLYEVDESYLVELAEKQTKAELLLEVKRLKRIIDTLTTHVNDK